MKKVSNDLEDAQKMMADSQQTIKELTEEYLRKEEILSNQQAVLAETVGDSTSREDSNSTRPNHDY